MYGVKLFEIPKVCPLRDGCMFCRFGVGHSVWDKYAYIDIYKSLGQNFYTYNTLAGTRATHGFIVLGSGQSTLSY